MPYVFEKMVVIYLYNQVTSKCPVFIGGRLPERESSDFIVSCCDQVPCDQVPDYS